MHTYREDFKMPGFVNAAAKGTTGAVKTAGKGVTSLPKTVGNKVLGPVWDFFKKIWAWFRWVLSVVCCVCVLSCCMSLGIPQMVLGGLKDKLAA